VVMIIAITTIVILKSVINFLNNTLFEASKIFGAFLLYQLQHQILFLHNSDQFYSLFN